MYFTKIMLFVCTEFIPGLSYIYCTVSSCIHLFFMFELRTNVILLSISRLYVVLYTRLSSPSTLIYVRCIIQPQSATASSNSSSVDQMDAGRRPLCPVHHTERFRNSENQNNTVNC